jgi:hypothetical protein
MTTEADDSIFFYIKTRTKSNNMLNPPIFAPYEIAEPPYQGF